MTRREFAFSTLGTQVLGRATVISEIQQSTVTDTERYLLPLVAVQVSSSIRVKVTVYQRPGPVQTGEVKVGVFYCDACKVETWQPIHEAAGYFRFEVTNLDGRRSSDVHLYLLS